MEEVHNSISQNSIMTYIIYEYEGCRHSKGPILFRGGATHYSDGEGLDWPPSVAHSFIWVRGI